MVRCPLLRYCVSCFHTSPKMCLQRFKYCICGWIHTCLIKIGFCLELDIPLQVLRQGISNGWYVASRSRTERFPTSTRANLSHIIAITTISMMSMRSKNAHVIVLDFCLVVVIDSQDLVLRCPSILFNMQPQRCMPHTLTLTHVKIFKGTKKRQLYHIDMTVTWR